MRCPDGRFRVIEDQLRMPAGFAYGVAARETLAACCRCRRRRADPHSLYGELATALRHAAPPDVDEPSMIVLCEGPDDGGWWEHELLARELGAPAVTLADLSQRNGRLVAWIGRAVPVDVVYQRTDEDRFTEARLPPRHWARRCWARAPRACWPCVNAPGSGVADDKLVHAYVDEMVRFYLSEEPLLPSIPSRPRPRATSLDELVLKPRGEMGGVGVVLWREAGEDEREAALSAIESEPGAFVAQELVELSVHPTVGATAAWSRATSTCARTRCSRTRA